MDLFAHRIHSATYVNGVVRLECSIVHPDAEGKYHPDAPVAPQDVTFSVNLPLQGFLRSMGSMRDLMTKLQKEGVLKGAGEEREGSSRSRREAQRALQDLSEEDRADSGSDNIV